MVGERVEIGRRNEVPELGLAQGTTAERLGNVTIRGNCPVQFQYGNFVKVVRASLQVFLIGLFSVACADLASAQAPPGPMTLPPAKDAPAPAPRPQVQKTALQPRTAIFGEWKFNRDDSDNPEQKLQDAQQASRSNGGYGGGGGGPRLGYPGGGMGGGGRRMGQQGMSDEERQKMQELMNPAGRLTVADLTNSGEVDLTDDQQRKRALFTDGRKLQKSKDANYQEITAHWSGKQLATDEKGPHGKMSRTYELSYDGTQLYENLNIPMGRNGSTLLVRYVYDAYGPPPAGAAASEPSKAEVPASTAPKQ
jgi:hypothetical protein